MKSIHLSALLGAWLVTAPAVAQVASYDCGKASTATEHAICASPSLGRKDVVAATYYDVLLQLKPAIPGMAYREFDDRLRDEQRQFLATRNACGAHTDCLEKSYDDRLATLHQMLDRYGAVVFDRATGP